MEIDDAIKIAKGCLDYCGGYTRNEDDREYHAFQHGILTVLTALERAISGETKEEVNGNVITTMTIELPKASDEAQEQLPRKGNDE